MDSLTILMYFGTSAYHKSLGDRKEDGSHKGQGRGLSVDSLEKVLYVGISFDYRKNEESK